MPIDGDADERVINLSEGLYDATGAVNISDSHASALRNVEVDGGHLEEARGAFPLHADAPRRGGVRFQPAFQRTSVVSSNVWREGFLWVPSSAPLAIEPTRLDISFRLNYDDVFPENLAVTSTRLFAGLTGRDARSIGEKRPGGEHQFFPLVGQGARGLEDFTWVLGIGVIRPDGYYSGTATPSPNPDRIVPVFAWWDDTLKKVAWWAGNEAVLPRTDYQLSLRLGSSPMVYLNGTVVAATSTAGVSSLPAILPVSSGVPLYFGRTYTREPDVEYAPAAGFDRKHAFAGKFDCTVDAVTATTIGVFGEELAFSTGLTTSYAGWRCRVLTGASKGKIFGITAVANPTNDGTITFTLAATHGIVVSDLVDIIPPFEPIAADVTIQECRLWRGGEDAAGHDEVIRTRLFTDPSSASPYENLGGAAEVGNLDLGELIGYWPLDDDGGVIARELISNAHAFFAPSVLTVDLEGTAAASDKALWLDGETQALYVDLSKDPNFRRNYKYACGAQQEYARACNFSARFSVYVGTKIANHSGTSTLRNFMTLVSLGDPIAKTAWLEIRLEANATGTYDVVFKMPNGASQRLGTITIAPGRWYNVICGIENLGTDPTDSQRHQLYWQTVDAGLTTTGAVADLPAFNPREIDTERESVLLFGASCAPTNNRGNGRSNHFAGAFGAVGYGFHPAHWIAPETGVYLPTTSIDDLIDFLTFDRVESREDCYPPVIGRDGGVTLEEGARSILTTDQTDIPRALKRFPVELEGARLIVTEEGEADREVYDHNIVESVSATGETKLVNVNDSATVRGAAIKAQVFAGYTDFDTVEPPEDTDLNAAREVGSNFAVTESVFYDHAESEQGFDMALDPVFEFVSPSKIAPRWDEGVVQNVAARINGLSQFKTSDGRLSIAVTSGGTLFDLDTRWRSGGPYSDDDFSWEFRELDIRRREEQTSRLVGRRLVRVNDPIAPREFLSVPDAYFKPAGGVERFQIDADIMVSELEGRRTIAGLADVDVVTDGGGTLRRLASINYQFGLDNGALFFLVQDRTNAAYLRVQQTGGSRVRAKSWVRCTAMVESDGTRILSVELGVNGRQVTTTTTSAGTLAVANLYEGDSNRACLGALASIDGMAAVDGLRGRMAGFRWATEQINTWPFIPEKIDATDVSGHIKVPFSEGTGYVLADAALGRVIFEGRSLRHVASGLGDPWPRPFAMTVFNDVLYGTNGRTRPFRYDRRRFSEAGVRAPVAELVDNTLTRKPLRLKDQGADLPDPVGGTSLCDLVGAAPQLRTFAGVTPPVGANEEGALVFIPAHPTMGAAGDFPCDYIGRISAALPATPGFTLSPAPLLEHRNTSAAAEFTYSIHRDKKELIPISGKVRDLIALMKSTTPWGAKRLVPAGRDDSDVPRIETLAANGDNPACFSFRGNQLVEVSGNQETVANGKVIDIKGYVWMDAYVSDRGDQVIAEQSVDGDRAAWRLVVFEAGRLRFEFFDTTLGDYRSIATCGRVITAMGWHYVRVRYRFKNQGAHVGDVRGGWEPDHRWLNRASSSWAKVNDFRDGLWVVACEGLHQINPLNINVGVGNGAWEGDIPDGPACALLTVPGAHSSLGGSGIAATAQPTFNHSQHLLNVGVLKDAPYLVPERGDPQFPTTGASANVDYGIVVTIIDQAARPIRGLGVAGANINGNSQLTLPANFVLPRMCSMNRDDAWNRDPTLAGLTTASQLFIRASGPLQNFFNQNGGNANSAGFAPGLFSPAIKGNGTSYGTVKLWAVLVRVWTVTDPNGTVGVSAGDQVDKAAGDDARVLAIVHLDANDIGTAAAGGTTAHRIFVTDDPLFGGDGLGDLQSGGTTLAAGAKVHATVELMNGQNQSVNSTNRNVMPCLLEQGTNPVGVQDTPNGALATFRFGGTRSQGALGKVLNGMRGRLDDVGVLIASLAKSTTNVYTTDCMAPDAHFTGPADTRFQSLPRLNFVHNALVLDVASGSTATALTVAMRFDTLSDNRVGVDTGASPNAGLATLVKVGSSVAQKGEHRFYVTFYDPDTGIESNPGPMTLVRVEENAAEGTEVTAESAFRLTGIPISGDRFRSLWRRIYKTFADGGEAFMLIEIRDDSTVELVPRPDDVKLATSRTLDIRNGRPPIARDIHATETNVIFVGLDDAPNVAAISKAFIPDQVPGTQVVFAESGRGGGLVASSHVRGVIVLAKRNALFVVQPAGDAFRIARVSDTVGCLAPNGMVDVDGTLFFVGQKGIYRFAGNQAVYNVSQMIESLYLDGLDLRQMERCFGASLLDRGLFLFLVKRRGDVDSRTIITGNQRSDQFGNPYQAFSLIEPATTLDALAEYERYSDETQCVVMGVAGRVCEYDAGGLFGFVADTQRYGGWRGRVSGTGNDHSLTIGSLNASLLPLREQLRGAPLQIIAERNQDGTLANIGAGCYFDIMAETQIVDLDAATKAGAGSTVITRDPIDADALASMTVLIGGRTWEWRSRWFTLGQEENRKAWNQIELTFKKIDQGFFFIEVFFEYDDDTPKVRSLVSTSTGRFDLALGAFKCRAAKVRLYGYGEAVGHEIYRMTISAKVLEGGHR